MTITQPKQDEAVIYHGQFGDFTITADDRASVITYRIGLLVAALSFAVGSFGLLLDRTGNILPLLTPLIVCFTLALGISLATIHIYLAVLHRLLQIFWAIGSLALVVLALSSSEPLALAINHHPSAMFTVDFAFAALTGIYFKEAFCFNRLETKLLTPLVPILLLGHLVGILPLQWERILLGGWAIFFIVLALRKVVQPIPPDIGDKSVFAYLKEHRSAKT